MQISDKFFDILETIIEKKINIDKIYILCLLGIGCYDKEDNEVFVYYGFDLKRITYVIAHEICHIVCLESSEINKTSKKYWLISEAVVDLMLTKTKLSSLWENSTQWTKKDNPYYNKLLADWNNRNSFKDFLEKAF